MDQHLDSSTHIPADPHFTPLKKSNRNIIPLVVVLVILLLTLVIFVIAKLFNVSHHQKKAVPITQAANTVHFPLGKVYFIKHGILTVLDEKTNSISTIKTVPVLQDIDIDRSKNQLYALINNDVYTIASNGAVIKQITNTSARVNGFAISPDGTKIAYDYIKDWIVPLTLADTGCAKEKCGEPLPETYIMNIDGSNAKAIWPPQIVHPDNAVLRPGSHSSILSWSPNSKSIDLNEVSFLSVDNQWKVDLQDDSATLYTSATTFNELLPDTKYKADVSTHSLAIVDRTNNTIFQDSLSTQSSEYIPVGFTPDQRFYVANINNDMLNVSHSNISGSFEIIDTLNKKSYKVNSGPSVPPIAVKWLNDLYSGRAYFTSRADLWYLDLQTKKIVRVTSDGLWDWEKDYVKDPQWSN